MSVVALLAVVYGLKQIAQDGVAVVPVPAIAGGLGVGALWVRRQRQLADA
jgi:DHA2 family multidrug resistance protein-like MFS transporter